MTKINVYMFWMGSEYPRVMKENISLLEKQENINLIVGPSKEDHAELMQSYKYYRRAVDQKKFAFAKDLWSIWVQKKYGFGLALDAGGKITDIKNFVKFCASLEHLDNYFVKETKITISNCFFYITNLKIIDGVLDFYQKNWWTKRIGPNIFTRKIRKYLYRANSWNREKIGQSIFAQIMEINNGETGYTKGGYGSWSSKNKSINTNKEFEVAWFVNQHTQWFQQQSWPNWKWKIGVWLKRFTFNY